MSRGHAAACSHCGFPVRTWWGARETVSPGQPVFCCVGCRIASSLRDSGEDSGPAHGTLIRLGLAIFFAMNVMVFALPTYGESVYREAGSAAGKELGQVFEWLQGLLTVPVLFLCGGDLLSSSLGQLRRGVVGLDALVATGAGAAFGVSAWSLWTGEGPTFFETTVVLLVFVTLGRHIEALVRLRAARRLGRLSSEEDRTWEAARGGETLSVRTPDLRPGDRLLLRDGDRVPFDGVLLGAPVEFDLAAVTGESRPRRVDPGEEVSAGSVLVEGTALVEAVRTGGESLLGRIRAIVEHAREAPTRAEALADGMSRVLLVATLLIAGGAWTFWAWRSGPAEALLPALSVLVVACPCTFAIATPLAAWAARETAARRGVLVREPDSLERLASASTVAFDKTGTLTTGRMRLLPEEEDAAFRGDLAVAAALAGASRHPVGRGLQAEAARRGLPLPEVREPRLERGLGVEAVVSGVRWRLGRAEWAIGCAPGVPAPGGESGGTRAVLAGEGGAVRVFRFSEDLRESARETVGSLRARGLRVVLLTGDTGEAAARVAAETGIGEVRAGLLPEGKGEAIAALGPATAMIGDEVNDAPALARAGVGIAVGSGADLAKGASGVVLLGEDLRVLPWLVDLARSARAVVRENLVFSIVYNLAGLAAAATGNLHPALAAVLMTTSSVWVIRRSRKVEESGGAAGGESP